MHVQYLAEIRYCCSSLMRATADHMTVVNIEKLYLNFLNEGRSVLLLLNPT